MSRTASRVGAQPAEQRNRRIGFVFALLVAMWVSEGLDQVLPGTWDIFGIRPRDTDHLLGILLSPFLHQGFSHLIANTGVLLVLGVLTALISRHVVSVTLAIIVLGGGAVWLLGAPGTVHIGASGLVYGYAGFLAVYGLAARRWLPALVGVAVIFFYGQMVWGVLPRGNAVSWEAHLFGGLAGALIGVWLGNRQRRAGRASGW